MEDKYIYIDESGDTGIKKEKGSSDYFVMCLVLVDGNECIQIKEKLSKIIDDLNIKPREVKFSKTSFKNKLHFFKGIKSINFTACVSVFDKLNKEKYAYYILKSLQSVDIDDHCSNLYIIIDGIDVNTLNSKNIKDIKNIFKTNTKVMFTDSKKEIFIQLADMLSGMIHSIYKGKLDYGHILYSLKDKIKITHLK